VDDLVQDRLEKDKCLSQQTSAKITNNEAELSYLTAMLATGLLLKHKGFSCALRFYPSGGAGINIYKYCQKQNKPLRRFALDYHPIWDNELKQSPYKLHYHRGESYNQIKKHRPYQGGW
jgi:hypothetical protein